RRPSPTSIPDERRSSLRVQRPTSDRWAAHSYQPRPRRPAVQEAPEARPPSPALEPPTLRRSSGLAPLRLEIPIDEVSPGRSPLSQPSSGPMHRLDGPAKGGRIMRRVIAAVAALAALVLGGGAGVVGI